MGSGGRRKRESNLGARNPTKFWLAQKVNVLENAFIQTIQ
jgi:hypothetical protein